MTSSGELSQPTESALVVLVPAAEPVVGPWRSRLDHAAAYGVPAHVTVLFPFVDPALLRGPAGRDGAGSVGGLAHVVARVREALAAVTPFAATFTEVRWFDERVVWLAPQPAERFVDLTERVCRAFPEHPPYGGAFDEVIPHLTVADSGALEQRRAAARDLADRVAAQPVRHEVASVQLLAGRPEPDGGWHVVADIPVGLRAVRATH